MQTGKILGIVGILIIGVFILVAIRNAAYNYPKQPTETGQIVNTQVSENLQTADLSFKNGNYYPQTITLKQGIPANIVVDTSKVSGCYKSIIIPAFNIKKYITPSNNIISFTPNKKGTFAYSCAMGMGYGKIVVE